MRTLVALIVLAVHAAGAQTPAHQGMTTAVIMGTVTDTALRPIDDVDVSFALTKVHVATDLAGKFKITNVPAGTFLLFARHLGYRPAANTLDIAAGDTLRIAFMLEPSAQVLAGVNVTESGASLRYREFEDRKKKGTGEFFTRGQIEARNPVAVYDILRQAKAVRIDPGLAGALLARSGRQHSPPCTMQIYVDGAPINGSLDLRLLPSPKEIAGIEIYSGPATVPLALNLPTGPIGHSCGVILLWTKDS